MEKEKKESKSNFKKNLIITIIVILAVITGIVLYSRYIATTAIKTNEYKITSSSITDNFHGFKVVQISDIHYGTVIDKIQMKKIIQEINLLKADIVVLTGDLLDDSVEINGDLSKEISELLAGINANVGKFAITGDNDIKIDEWESIIRKGGFDSLNDTYQLIYNNGYNSIIIAGLSTHNNSITINERFSKIEEFINSSDETSFKLLLTHEPDYIDNININKFNLILSGHSLGGQIKIPFCGSLFLQDGSKKYSNDHYKIGETDLYVSNGLGTTKNKFRLFNTPSINLFRLTNK